VNSDDFNILAGNFGVSIGSDAAMTRGVARLGRAPGKGLFGAQSIPSLTDPSGSDDLLAELV
jgi:hypothetical protein